MADSLKSSVTPDDPQNQSTLSSKNVAEFASEVELEKWVNLVEQLRTRDAAPVFAQPPDPTGSFSASTVPNPESSWPESEVEPTVKIEHSTALLSDDEIEARLHADQEATAGPLWDAISTHGGRRAFQLLPDDWRLVGEIESRAHFERVLHSPGNPLSLLRRCIAKPAPRTI